MGQVFATANVEETSDGGEIKGINKDTHNTEVQPPLSLYKTANGVPYSVKFFDVKEYSELNGLLDVDKMIDKVSSIEKYVKEYIKDHHLEDTTESYDYIMKEIFNKLKINEHETTVSKLKRVTSYIKMLEKGKNKYA